jgi:hypothetical protein
MWLVLLESTKDWVLGVDTPEQPVLPHVQYGMACLLIRNTIGSMSCSIEWRTMLEVTWDPLGASGPVLGNLSTASGALGEETIAKHDILL